MNTGLKISYILFGAGIGAFATCLYFEKEFNKPIGEIEEYIPKSETESNEDEKDSDETLDNDVLNYYKPDKKDLEDIRRDEFERSREERNKNQKTRYSKMYQSDESSDDDILDSSVLEKLEEQRKANEEYISRTEQKAHTKQRKHVVNGVEFDEYGSPEDDISYDDDTVLADNELVRDRVESNFEVYLGENPQDFVTLIFYEGDNTLADDKEHVVPAADEVVGLAALSRLIEGGPGAENGVIYVRNLKTMINYEVVLDAGSYSETVLGIFNSRSRPNKVVDGNGDRE